MKKSLKQKQILVKKLLIIAMLVLVLLNIIFGITIFIKNILSKNKEKTIETYSSIEEFNEITTTVKEIDSSIDDWNLILVNKDNSIGEDYEVETKIIEGEHKCDYRIIDSLKEMLKDARKQGLDPIICSSYRTTKKQKSLFTQKVNYYKKLGYSKEDAEKEASYWVTLPGTSEHEIGLAVDIVSYKYQILDEKQEETKVQKWLMEHCSDYGFILRYPTEKKEITKINYEPWHYRYVGIENAKFMEEKGFCLEEFIEYLK